MRICGTFLSLLLWDDACVFFTQRPKGLYARAAWLQCFCCWDKMLFGALSPGLVTRPTNNPICFIPSGLQASHWQGPKYRCICMRESLNGAAAESEPNHNVSLCCGLYIRHQPLTLNQPQIPDLYTLTYVSFYMVNPCVCVCVHAQPVTAAPTICLARCCKLKMAYLAPDLSKLFLWRPNWAFKVAHWLVACGIY